MLFLIYTLDISLKTHEQKDNNSMEEYECKKPNNIIYVDDCFGIINGTNANIWSNVKNYLKTMNEYFIDNKL